MLLRRTAVAVGAMGCAALGLAPRRRWDLDLKHSALCETPQPLPPRSLPKMFDLSGRVALVTGGSKGLGFEIAHVLAEAGCTVIISSRNEAELEAARLRLIAARDGTRCTAIACDLSRRDEAVRLAREACAAYGRVDILVNNAGATSKQSASAVTDSEWERIQALNVTAAMTLTRELSPQMAARGWGRIINISSILGHMAKEARSAYCTSKSALLGLTRAGAIDLGPLGITVNALSPGYFLTDMPRAVMTKEQLQTVSERSPLGRLGEPRELAGAALLLASEAGSFVTGTTLLVDGGYTIMGA